MTIWPDLAIATRPVHAWLRKVHATFVPGPTTPLLDKVVAGILGAFDLYEHDIQPAPDNDTDIILTTARFGETLGWREALMFSARRRFNLRRNPTVFTLMHIRPADFQRMLGLFGDLLAKDTAHPADYDFPGLSSDGYRVLYELGLRGGPIMSLQRLVQGQSKSIRVILIVGEDEPEAAYHFDLVGAYPKSDAADLQDFYTDIVLRMVTSVSTATVTRHEVVGDPIDYAIWSGLNTPEAMRVAGQELGQRNFFTRMVQIGELVQVPSLNDAIASQYSEGCFATWDATVEGLIATVTGSARPVDKGNIGDDDLAVIVGVRPDGGGAYVRQVDGKRNDPPSSEAVEMMDMDALLPHITLDPSWDIVGEVPVIRSKLHGHRGIGAYNPEHVEFVPLDEPYYHYPVSCATEAQARAIKSAFARSKALQNPDDPRRAVFTILPGHGLVVVEKWAPGTVPFQLLWEFMDAGYIQIENGVPQGPMAYVPGPNGRMILYEE